MEPFFLLGYYFGMDWNTYYRFPVTYKRWLIERINTEIKSAHSTKSVPQDKSPQSNTDDIRALVGTTRTAGTSSSRMHRFT